MSRKEAALLPAALSLFLLVSFPCYPASSGPASKLSKVCFEQICFTVETAKTNAERRRGLMYRETLKPETGMLFLFEKEGILPIWMKNVRVPLDILWLDREGTVVHFEEQVQPCRSRDCPSYFSSRPAAYVLETPAGSIRRHELAKGMRADIVSL